MGHAEAWCGINPATPAIQQSCPVLQHATPARHIKLQVVAHWESTNVEEKRIGTTCMNLPIAVFFLAVLPALQTLVRQTQMLRHFTNRHVANPAYVHVLPLGVGFSHLPAPMPTSPHAPGTLQTTTSACGSGGKRWKTGHSPKQNVQNAWQTLTQNKSVGSGEAYQY